MQFDAGEEFEGEQSGLGELSKKSLVEEETLFKRMGILFDLLIERRDKHGKILFRLRGAGGRVDILIKDFLKPVHRFRRQTLFFSVQPIGIMEILHDVYVIQPFAARNLA
ncbi:MAG: hypothetical protein ALMCE001_03480 [Methanocorpusculum sp. MCE]|nr:MAG: hypothetical protein ALMCE001_03480 [Methanocorpusculum sp. MCE]